MERNIPTRTAYAELAIRLLIYGYAFDIGTKLNFNQTADLLVWIKDVDKFFEELESNSNTDLY